MKNQLRTAAVAVLALAIAGVGFANPAHAVVVRDRHWDSHVVEARRYHVIHPRMEPHVVYAPPAVVYAPPPPPPEAGINLIVPLNFR